jgi:prepilin-type N-terminal cleavage/methylation domain-containing protein
MSREPNIQVAALTPPRGADRGLTLIELVISIVIAGIMMVSLFFVYNHACAAVDSISATLDRNELPDRILQLIAQDIDRFSADTQDLTIIPALKTENGLTSSSLYLESRIYNNASQAVTYEKVTWETRFDSESQAMILYRSHDGLVSEDDLLESQRTDEERRAFVPLCAGLTYFRVSRVPVGMIGLPNQIVVSLSFAEPQKEGDGYSIPPEQIITRTIAVNRLRKIGYIFTEPNLAEPNTVSDSNTPAKKSTSTAGASRQGGTSR